MMRFWVTFNQQARPRVNLDRGSVVGPRSGVTMAQRREPSLSTGRRRARRVVSFVAFISLIGLLLVLATALTGCGGSSGSSGPSGGLAAGAGTSPPTSTSAPGSPSTPADTLPTTSPCRTRGRGVPFRPRSPASGNAPSASCILAAIRCRPAWLRAPSVRCRRPAFAVASTARMAASCLDRRKRPSRR